MNTSHAALVILSIISGCGAFLFCIFAWIADATTGKFIRKETNKWFKDAAVFFAVAIWLGIVVVAVGHGVRVYY